MNLVDFDPTEFRVISGGQTGTDRAALIAAREFGFATGGWLPKGCRTTEGPAPWLIEEFGMVETDNAYYGVRTELNAKNSDATLRIAMNFWSPGELMTERFVNKHRKPILDVRPGTRGWNGSPTADDFVRWVRSNNVLTLNVAGNSEATVPGMTEVALGILRDYFAKLKEDFA